MGPATRCHGPHAGMAQHRHLTRPHKPPALLASPKHGHQTGLDRPVGQHCHQDRHADTLVPRRLTAPTRIARRVFARAICLARRHKPQLACSDASMWMSQAVIKSVAANMFSTTAIAAPATRGGPSHGIEAESVGQTRFDVPLRELVNLPAAPVSSHGIARMKRAVDIAGAAVLLVLLAPVMALIALVIRSNDGGPVLVSHTRVGQGGTSFRCLKFRSMTVNAEAVLARILREDPAAHEEWTRTRKLRRDPRVTSPGRILRATSLDEIPQLLNVLRGEMSLVGPRPVVAEEVLQHYGAGAAPYYLAVRPGITGLWQVSGRSTRSYAERVALDIDYVRRMSLRRDLVILARTVAVVLTRRGAY
jgi:exopolysaccharide production protein ExoY